MARLTLEQIKETAKEAGFEYLSGDYQNLKSVLMFKCGNNHSVPLTVTKLRQKVSCPVCQQFEQRDKIETDIGLVTSKKGMRILALDNATNISGWAVIENGKPIESGIFKAQSSHDQMERIIEISQWLSGMIYAWEIDFLGLEDVYYSGNAQTLILLSKLLGVLDYIGREILEKPTIVVSPSTWRSHCGVKGKSKIKLKESAQSYVKETFGIVASQDRSDAICLGIYVSHKCRFDTEEMVSW